MKIEGYPSWAGNSGKLTALNPRAALARTSAAATSTSASHGSCSGMMRSGWVPAHTSWCHWFHARSAGQAELGVVGTENTEPQNPATSDGKHREAQIPLRSMSAIRAPMS